MYNNVIHGIIGGGDSTCHSLLTSEQHRSSNKRGSKGVGLRNSLHQAGVEPMSSWLRGCHPISAQQLPPWRKTKPSRAKVTALL